MNGPAVSVVIPAFRCASTVCMAVDSALNQGVDLEILVINDCSPDGLDGVLERYREHPAVRIIKNEKRLGAAASRNLGVKLARGKYVAFLDADDCWAARKLLKQLSLLEKGEAVMCVTARELMRRDGVGTGRILPVRERITYRDLLRHNCVSCSSVVIRADVAREFPMEHEDSHEDYIMWLRVLRKYGFARGINEPLLRYRLGSGGKSGGKLQSARMTYRVYRYMGFPASKRLFCFCSYAFHGLCKYYLPRSKRI